MKRAGAPLILAVLVVSVVAASGCGGGGGLSPQKRAAQANDLAAGVRANQADAARKVWSLCSKQLGRFQRAVRKTDDQLYTSTEFAEYDRLVRHMGEEEDSVDLPNLDDRCLPVERALERATQAFSIAWGNWGVCEITPGAAPCKKLDPFLQRKWDLGRAARENADRLLRNLLNKPGPNAPRVGGFTRTVPEDAGSVEGSVYGQAESVYCDSSMNVAATDACEELRRVLSDGVASDELGDLDDAVQKLLDAEGLSNRSS